MSCRAHCCAVEDKFTHRTAESDLRRYRRKGPDDTTARILEMVRGQQLQDATLLDVGGGIGVLAHELLDDGVRRAVLVDGSTGYLTVASEEAASRGTGERLRVLHGDFVEVARDLETADIVTLDRVVCCYPDYRALLAVAAAKSRNLLAVSYPRDRWFVRLVIAVENLARRLARNAFRTFVHPTHEMHGVLDAAGYRPVQEHNGFVWRVTLLERMDGSPR